MERPYIICHILSALDGKITGAFMGTESTMIAGREYAWIRTEYRAEAWLYGTITTKEFTNGRKPVFPSDTNTDMNVPAGDYIAENQAKLYYVSLDTKGEI